MQDTNLYDVKKGKMRSLVFATLKKGLIYVFDTRQQLNLSDICDRNLMIIKHEALSDN